MRQGCTRKKRSKPHTTKVEGPRGEYGPLKRKGLKWMELVGLKPLQMIRVMSRTAEMRRGKTIHRSQGEKVSTYKTQYLNCRECEGKQFITH